jgi:isochorismate synthase
VLDSASFNISLARFTVPELVAALFNTAVSNGFGFAAWRLPQADSFTISISRSSTSLKGSLKVENSHPGFVMHPFEVSEKNRAWFLASTVQFTGSFDGNTFHELANPDPEFAQTFLKLFITVLETPDNRQADWYVANAFPATASALEFESLVQNGISFMQKGKAEKVVLSRAAKKELPAHFSPITGFQNLCRQYPTAFISLVSAPETGTWLGASPEILVLKNKENIFRTMALAGTQKLASGQKPADAIWRQKEIEEQSNVVRYIISCFKKIRLRDYIETGPRTVVAGNLLHLRTDYCVHLNDHPEFPNLTTDMLQLLHPTSAVCGQPREAALEFIKANENYDRRYYSGYLGPVNIERETSLFVNLRCLELQQKAAILYAGAGITPDSDPAKEWQETELKMQTVSAALQLFTSPDDTATGY